MFNLNEKKFIIQQIRFAEHLIIHRFIAFDMHIRFMRYKFINPLAFHIKIFLCVIISYIYHIYSTIGYFFDKPRLGLC